MARPYIAGISLKVTLTKSNNIMKLMYLYSSWNPGAYYLNDCTIERFIPIYLIVFGAVTIVQDVFSMFLKISQRSKGDDGSADGEEQKSNPCVTCFSSIMSCFLAAWFIAGMQKSVRFLHLFYEIMTMLYFIYLEDWSNIAWPLRCNLKPDSKFIGF